MSGPMLAWYQDEVLDQIPEQLSLDPAYAAATDLTFRDEQGVWWRPQSDGSWIRYGTGGWEHGDRPAALEGTTPLPVGIAASTAGLGDTSEPTMSNGPAGALTLAIARIEELYHTGVMVSTMAELALSDRKLIATDGSLWTVGAQSKSWYRYGNETWEREDGPPESFLSGDRARTVARADDSPLQRWAELGPLLPERITAPWNAPDPPDALLVAASTAVPPPPKPTTPGLDTERQSGTRKRDRWLIGAAFGFLLTAFLPWHSSYSFYGETAASQASAAFLWNIDAEEGEFVVGILILVIGGAALASLYVERLQPYRRRIGWLAFGIAALWTIQSFRYINYWNEDFVESAIDLFGAELAVGPWVALLTGLMLWLKR